ncbi:MAG: hypothetical protein H0W43_04250 [Chthoniobacterales bacterium]|nr:hypothetical protein [Chthoniobacterales bacterium]
MVGDRDLDAIAESEIVRTARRDSPSAADNIRANRWSACSPTPFTNGGAIGADEDIASGGIGQSPDVVAKTDFTGIGGGESKVCHRRHIVHDLASPGNPNNSTPVLVLEDFPASSDEGRRVRE